GRALAALHRGKRLTTKRLSRRGGAGPRPRAGPGSRGTPIRTGAVPWLPAEPTAVLGVTMLVSSPRSSSRPLVLGACLLAGLVPACAGPPPPRPDEPQPLPGEGTPTAARAAEPPIARATRA